MKFNGSVGAMCIVIALLLTILASAGLNITSQDVSTVKYDYVTDISGLYDYSETSEYIEYSPATNYTGYTLKGENVTLNNTPYKNSIQHIDLPSNHTITLTYVSPMLTVTLDGTTIYNRTFTDYAFICGWDNDHVEYNLGGIFTMAGLNNNTTITTSGTTITMNGQQYDNCSYINVVSESGDYVVSHMPNPANKYYVNNINDVYTGWLSTDNSTLAYSHGNNMIRRGTNISATVNIPTTAVSHYNYVEINNISSYQPSAYSKTFNSFFVITPKTVTGTYYSNNNHGISYTAATNTNNYVIKDTTLYENGTVTLTGGTSAGSISWSEWVSWRNGNGGNSQSISSPMGYTDYKKSLSSIISGLSYSANTTHIRIDCTQTISELAPYLSGSWVVNYPIELSWISSATTPTNCSYTVEYGDGPDHPLIKNTHPYAIYTISTGDVIIYDYNNLPIMSGPLSDFYVYWSSVTTEKIYWQAYGETYSYININEGVKINNSNAAYYTQWANGYQNGIVEVVFKCENGNTQSITTNAGNVININYTTTLTVQIDSNIAIDCGAWQYFVLVIDGQSGTVQVQPVYNFVNYSTFTEIGDIINIGTITKSPITYLNFGSTTNRFKFSVYNTFVDMGTKSLLMIDPTISISDYYPNEDNLKLNMYSFAAYGSKITINNVDYAVTNGTITISDNGISKTYNLNDISITFEDSKVYLTFNKDNKTYDLGSKTTDTISYTGAWFFTTGLYKGTQTVNKEYVQSWTTDNLLKINDQDCMIFIGLLVVFTLISARFFNPGTIDYILIIAAGAITLFMFIGW